jgi:hypothetical protein
MPRWVILCEPLLLPLTGALVFSPGFMLPGVAGVTRIAFGAFAGLSGSVTYRLVKALFGGTTASFGPG